jgi:excisionase family DNA binding protein
MPSPTPVHPAPASASSDRQPGKVAWTIAEWRQAVGLSRAFIYELIAAGRIDSVKVGARRLIVTPPAFFIASLRR